MSVGILNASMPFENLVCLSKVALSFSFIVLSKLVPACYLVSLDLLDRLILARLIFDPCLADRSRNHPLLASHAIHHVYIYVYV